MAEDEKQSRSEWLGLLEVRPIGKPAPFVLKGPGM
jgi:hypothetical protein